MQPRLYIIAGCNGAGKTTASFTILPDILQCREFVNSDEIARGLSPFNPMEMAVEAGRLMLQRIDALLAERQTFAIETTLAPKSQAGLVRRAQSLGYTVHLLFFWLSSPRQAIERVARRVSEGGHSVPDHVIIRRYIGGLVNLRKLFLPIVDSWMIVDNSDGQSRLVASNEKIVNQDIYQRIMTYER